MGQRGGNLKLSSKLFLLTLNAFIIPNLAQAYVVSCINGKTQDFFNINIIYSPPCDPSCIYCKALYVP